jgi:hypothetical protein
MTRDEMHEVVFHVMEGIAHIRDTADGMLREIEKVFAALEDDTEETKK